MKTAYQKIKNNIKKTIFFLVILFGAAYFFFNGKTEVLQIEEAKISNIEQSVALSGKIETSDKADLGFASSGRVAKILVKNNQEVKAGTVLAQLEIDDLLADLEIKQANSKTSNVDTESAKDELEKVISRENTNVENSYRTLLSEDLELVSEDSKSTLTAPVISGLYDGGEGQYKVIFEKNNSNDTVLSMRTFGLERSYVSLNEVGKSSLGTRGLYITLAEEDGLVYKDTVWYLDIPNKGGASYLANYNAYNSAKITRDIAIKNAQAAYDKLITRGDSGVSVAQAEIQKILSEIKKNTIYAPFNGRVTNIEKEVGENASTGERVITVLGEKKLQIVLQVSELDVGKLVPGSSIKITVDAIPDEKFDGVLKTVNSRETEVEGVPVYEAFVEIAPDTRIKNGMNASGLVILAQKDGVVVLPKFVITKNDGKSTVEVLSEDGKTTATREVVLGLEGTNGQVEIISGLEPGEKVVASK